jgi:hypothetical protein
MSPTRILLCLLAFATAAKAGELPATAPKVDSRIHAAAYGLLIESYRQIQTSMIEADYGKQLQAIALIKDPKEREQLTNQAGQNHELRLVKLQSTLHNFTAAYDSTRPKTQGAEPPPVDAKAANDRLRTLVPLTPAQFGPSEGQPSQLLPAGAQMIYGQRH